MVMHSRFFRKLGFFVGCAAALALILRSAPLTFHCSLRRALKCNTVIFDMPALATQKYHFRVASVGHWSATHPSTSESPLRLQQSTASNIHTPCLRCRRQDAIGAKTAAQTMVQQGILSKVPSKVATDPTMSEHATKTWVPPAAPRPLSVEALPPPPSSLPPSPVVAPVQTATSLLMQQRSSSQDEDLRRCEVQQNLDRVGHDIGSEAASDATHCCQLCTQTPNCQAWTFVQESTGGTCWLKSAIGSARPDTRCTSGTVKPSAAATPSPQPQPAKAAMPLPTHNGGRTASDGAVRLIIAVPTVARDSVDYLTPTVTNLLAEAAAAVAEGVVASVDLLIFSHTVPHSAYESIKQIHPDSKIASPDATPVRIFFRDDAAPGQRLLDPHANDQQTVDDHRNPDDRPGVKVRQQSMDMIAMLRWIAEHVESRTPAPASTAATGDRYFVLMSEDDAPLCPGGLTKIGRAILAAEDKFGRAGLPQAGDRPKSGWASLRFSIGFIGIVLPLPALPSFGQFLRRYYLLKPPDILVIEWMHGDWEGGVRHQGEAMFTSHSLAELQSSFDLSFSISIAQFVAKDRARVRKPGILPHPKIPHLTSHANVFVHLGAKSSLRATGTSSFPKCDVSFSGALWAFEQFSSKCRGQLISPC